MALNDSVERHLLISQGMVNQQLQFAEAKNAALITFNGAGIYVSALGQSIFPQFLLDILPIIHVMLVLSIGTSLLAFMPVMNPPAKPSPKEVRQRENLGNHANIYFFGHLRLFDPDELVRYLHEMYGDFVPEKSPRSDYFLSSQVILQSRIAWRKLFLFSMASQLTLTALIFPLPILAVFWIVRMINRRKAASEERILLDKRRTR